MSRLMKAMALVALLLVTVFSGIATAECRKPGTRGAREDIRGCESAAFLARKRANTSESYARFTMFDNSGFVKYANSHGIEIKQPMTPHDFPCNKQAQKDADGGAACRDYPANTGNIWRLVFDGRRVVMSAHNLDTGAWASFNDMTHQLAHEEPGSGERPAYTGAGSSAPIAREIVPEAVGDSARKALGSLLGR